VRTDPSQAGFSLLEILVAFAVLALTLGVLLRIFSGGTHTARMVDEYTRALSIGESLLASVGVEAPLQEGETEGDVDERYHWWLRVSPFPLDPELLATEGKVAPPVQPWWLELAVEWGDGSERRDIRWQTLRTLRTGTGLNTPQPRIPFR
jgi:general secretion pathway protein I